MIRLFHTECFFKPKYSKHKKIMQQKAANV